jgi:nitrite reductase/ring-hydroxylating ferredoxin subunit
MIIDLYEFLKLKLARRFASIAVVLSIVIIPSCDRDLSDDQIPFASFGAITINLNLPEYQKLRTQGNIYLNSGGIRGIILYQVNSSTYVAYERNCSYQPNEACATVDVHTSNLYLQDPCCGSTFDFATGNPTSGVAWRPLRKYETFISGTQLTITDTVID